MKKEKLFLVILPSFLLFLLSATPLPQDTEFIRIRMNEPSGDVGYFSPVNPETQAPYYAGTITTQGTTSSEIGCGLDRARYFDQDGSDVSTDADVISLSHDDVLEQGQSADTSLTIDFWFRYAGGGNQSSQDLINYQGWDGANYGGWNIWFSPDTNTVNFKVWGATVAVGASVSIPGTPGEWVHVKAVKDGTSDPDTIGICAAVNGNEWNCGSAVEFVDTINYLPDTVLDIGAWRNGSTALDNFWHGYIDDLFLTTSGGISGIDGTQDTTISPGCLPPNSPTPTNPPTITPTPTQTITMTPTATPYCTVKNDSCGDYFITAAEPFTLNNNNNQSAYHIVEVRQPGAEFVGILFYTDAYSYNLVGSSSLPPTSNLIIGGGSPFSPKGPNWWCVARPGEQLYDRACKTASIIKGVNLEPYASKQYDNGWNSIGWPGETVRAAFGINANECYQPGGICDPGEWPYETGYYEVYFIWKKLDCNCPLEWLNGWCSSTYANVYQNLPIGLFFYDGIFAYYEIREYLEEGALNPYGKILIDLYKDNGEEIIRELAAHPELIGEAYELLEKMEPKLGYWRDGLGDTVTITSEDTSDVENFVNDLIDVSTEDLQIEYREKLQELRDALLLQLEIFDLFSLAGLTMNQAWDRMNYQYNLSLTPTIPSTPTVTLTPTATDTPTPSPSPSPTQEPVTVTVLGPGDSPESDLTVWAMDGDTYTGYSGVTNSSGQVTLYLPEGSYRFKVEKSGHEFWSAPGNHCTVPGCAAATVTTMDEVVVTVLDTGGNPESGANVLAYDGESYTGYGSATDAQGQATIWLPAGDYRFRVMKNGTAFWSGAENHCTVPGCTSASITTNSSVTVTVENLDGQPEFDLTVYVFDGETNTGIYGDTDAQGQVTFTLPDGSYRFRVWKDSRYFWSGASNHCAVPSCTSAAITTDNTVIVTVQDIGGNPDAGLWVVAYNGSASTGIGATTDAQGQARLALPAGSYRFRVVKNNTVFWSGAENHCTIPGCTSATITTNAAVTVTVQNLDGQPEFDLTVYVFDGTTNTGIYGDTDAQGRVTFALPTGNYRFRVWKDSRYFWSGTSNHCAVPGCTAAAITTDNTVIVTVQDTNGNPDAGLWVVAYNGSASAGIGATTDAQGQARLALPTGNYRFRVVKNGTVFWSGAENHCAISGCTSATITTNVPVVVTVLNLSGQPEAGLPVYAFNGTTFTNLSAITNAQGQASFTLPNGNYRFRVDKNGWEFWSGTENHCAIPSCTSVGVTIRNTVVVTVLDTVGNPDVGAEVWAYTGSTYANVGATTNAQGQAFLMLPEGSYHFRTSKDYSSFWSGADSHCTVPNSCVSASITTNVPMIVTVTNLDGQPEAGVYVHAFDGNTFIKTHQTNAQGQASFVLPDGNYRFRVDKNGWEFWSWAANHCAIPSCTSVGVTIRNTVVVTVLDTAGNPDVGAEVWAYTGSTYANVGATTNAQGQAFLMLPEGSYHFRTSKDYSSFWSGADNHCTVPNSCTSASITTNVPVIVTVTNLGGQPEAGIYVHAFDGSTFIKTHQTNAQGQATFVLPDGNYRFRVDKNGWEFWSGTSNHCAIPGCTAVSVTINNTVVVTVLDSNGQPDVGVNVRAYNGSTDTGYVVATNAQGQATLLLPAGSYRFRANKNGTVFWSGETNHCTVPGCTTASITTNVPVTVTVLDLTSQPLAGLSVYAFDGTTFTNLSAITNAQGQAIFTLPQGSYRFRVDQGGHEFWSGIENHCTVPGCTEVAISVDTEMAGLLPNGIFACVILGTNTRNTGINLRWRQIFI